MPPIILLAIAIAILIIGISAGFKMPELDEIVKPVAENTGRVFAPVGYCIGIAVLFVAAIFALGRKWGGR